MRVAPRGGELVPVVQETFKRVEDKRFDRGCGDAPSAPGLVLRPADQEGGDVVAVLPSFLQCMAGDQPFAGLIQQLAGERIDRRLDRFAANALAVVI